MKRKIKAKHQAIYEPIADLVTYRATPTASLPMNALDPFIFLNHHGWQTYKPNNRGLPFGPHPHRGFETVTFILEGDLMHKDSSGAASVIKEGGVQWMTAGSGLIHAEISSDNFKQQGGPLEILQLWVNLPAQYKMTAPKYTGLQKEELPTVQWNDGKATAYIISGHWQGTEGAIKPLSDIHLTLLYLQAGSQLTFNIPAEKTIFLYVVKGEATFNNEPVGRHYLVEFAYEGEELTLETGKSAIVLLGYATPFKEPFVAHGPFVMNTREEIMQAYDDYNKGKFGDADAL